MAQSDTEGCINRLAQNKARVEDTLPGSIEEFRPATAYHDALFVI